MSQLFPPSAADVPDPGISLGGIPGLPPGLPPQLAMQPEAPPPPDPLSALQDAIHAVTSAMQSLPDPQDTQEAAQALLQLSKIQTRLMQSAAPQG